MGMDSESGVRGRGEPRRTGLEIWKPKTGCLEIKRSFGTIGSINGKVLVKKKSKAH